MRKKNTQKKYQLNIEGLQKYSNHVMMYCIVDDTCQGKVAKCNFLKIHGPNAKTKNEKNSKRN